MSRSFIIAVKDLKLLIRDKTALFWVLVFPLVIAILFGSIFGGSSGASRIEVRVIDGDNSPQSQSLVKKLQASQALKVEAESRQDKLPIAQDDVRKGKLTAYIFVPQGFGEEVRTFQYAKGPALRIGLDPSRKAEGGILQGVLSEAAYGLMSEGMNASGQNASANLEAIRKANLPADQKTALSHLLEDLQKVENTGALGGTASKGFDGPTITSDKISAAGATPASAFEITFPQALIWGLLGAISAFAISIVKEREQGTLVRLRAAPIGMGQILGGKGLACFFACIGMMAVLLAIGHFLFGMRIASPLLLAMAIGSGSFCVVGIMMLLSVMGRTEQAVAGSSWGVMIMMAMFGGGMIPVFAMPGWMQTASNASPLKWTVLSIEGAIWRGFTLQEMLMPCAILIAIGVVTFAIGTRVLKARA